MGFCVFLIAVPVLDAQTPPGATPASAPQNARTAPAAQNTTTQSDQRPTFTTPPVAIVPVDKAIPGAALEVDGPMQAWNGKAYLTGSGSITAGNGTAEVALPLRGTLRVCASSSVKLAADASAPAGEVPGLLIALDRGAVEMSFAASTAREKNADTLLTPYFRILIGGPNAADVKVRLGEHGDTCVDNRRRRRALCGREQCVRWRPLPHAAGAARDVRARQPAIGCGPGKGTVRLPTADRRSARQRVSTGAERRPCAVCVAASRGCRAFCARRQCDRHTQLQRRRTRSANRRPRYGCAAAPAASATPAPQAPAKQKKPGFFGKIGQFFRKIFGAE